MALTYEQALANLNKQGLSGDAYTAALGYLKKGFEPGGASYTAPTPSASTPSLTPPTLTLPSLPQQNPQGDLTQFLTTMDSVLQLAKEKRNALGTNLMNSAFPAGTLKASDFGGVLQNLNASSGTTVNDLLDIYKTQKTNDANTVNDNYTNAINAAKDKYNADLNTYNAQVKATTGSAAGDTIKSGSLVYTPVDFKADATALNASRGADHYVDPSVYQKLYDAWLGNGGLPQDFLRAYPPEYYVNPANTWLPKILMPKKPADSTDGGYTPTELRKLEQAGLSGAPRQQQLDYLYGQNSIDSQINSLFHP